MSAVTHLLVAAIDFGTTFSGYAYSFRTEFDKDPLKIFANIEWNSGNTEGGTSTCATLKTPTTVLFDENRKFHSFGYEAETKYADLLEEDEAKGWFYFKHFKMALYREMGFDENALGKRRRAGKITRNLQLRDQEGKKMDALIVFSEAIKYLKNHLLATLKESTEFVDENDILWVLTVPAIWGQEAKQFMREAAEMSGIEGEKLQLALEPEAAAIYCKELAIQKTDDVDEQSMESFQSGQSFMIVDCGGGTVDITIHRVKNGGSLEELCTPSGGPWGGTNVDMRFYEFLSECFGKGTWKSFKKNSPLSFLELQRAFDVKKRINGKEDKITLTNGISDIMDEFKSEMKREFSVPENLNKSVKLVKKRLRIDIELIKGFFEEAIDGVSSHLKNLFVEPEIERVNTILMVGGFSESSILKEKIKAMFPTKKFIIPREASLAVLKGAVIFGHCQKSIATRLSPATFGVATDVPFVDNEHPSSHKHVKDGLCVCTDVFKPIVIKGQPQIHGETFHEDFFRPSYANDTIAEIEVYASTNKEPVYTTDEDCTKVGVMKIQIPDTTKGKDRLIRVTMHLGHTELFVTAVENVTNNKVYAKFDCLI